MASMEPSRKLINLKGIPVDLLGHYFDGFRGLSKSETGWWFFVTYHLEGDFDSGEVVGP